MSIHAPATALSIGNLNGRNAQAPSSLKKVGYWQGSLALEFRLKSHKTVLSSCRHNGPYTVQRPFYPEGGICHSIILHPPGGLVEGDTLELNVHCHHASHSLITTPSAGKVYECSAFNAGQDQHFVVDDKAILEWFPQEMILYDRSLSHLQTSIELSGSGCFAGWEIVCFGRAVAGDFFEQGSLHQLISIYRDGQPLLIERTRIDAGGSLINSSIGLGGYSAMATFIITSTTKDDLATARKVADTLFCEQPTLNQQLTIAFTQIDDIIIARVLMNQSRFAKTLMIAVWSALRESVIKVAPQLPRIWST